MALIEYDAVTQTLHYYKANPATLTAASPQASTTITDAYMSDPDVAYYFKQMPWVAPARSLLGPGRVLADAEDAVRVTGATFAVTRSA
jgi:hypothetical protein